MRPKTEHNIIAGLGLSIIFVCVVGIFWGVFSLLTQPNGTFDKVEYKDHSYLRYAYNSRHCLVHDPDCKCGGSN